MFADKVLSCLENYPSPGCFLNSGSPRRMDDTNNRLPHPIYGYSGADGDEPMENMENNEANVSREDYKSADEGEEFEIVNGKPSPASDADQMNAAIPTDLSENEWVTTRNRTFNADPPSFGDFDANVPIVEDAPATPNTPIFKQLNEPIIEQKAPSPPPQLQEKVQNTTFNTKRPERQKTMVVSSSKSSPSVSAVKDIFEKARMNGDYEDAERAVLTVIANHEKMMTAALATKLDQLQTQLAHSEANRETWKFIHEGTVNVLKNNGQKIGTMGGVDTSKHEQLVKSYQQLQNEHNQLYTMYQKSFEYVDQLKAQNKHFKDGYDEAMKTEEIYKADIKGMAERYNRLLEHSKEKISAANNHVRKVEEKASTDRLALSTKLTAIASLEQQLEAKAIENRELQSICNTLMEKLHSFDAEDGASEISYQDV